MNKHPVPVRIALALLAVACFVGAGSLPALAKDKAGASASAPAKLPEPLTKESIRELVSRLDDAEVRALLIKQLDRAAAEGPKKNADDMAAMAQTMGGELAQIRARAAAVAASAGDFPAVLGQVATRIADPFDPSRLWAVAGWFLVMLAAGAAVELAVRFATRAALRRYEEQPVQGLAAASVRFAHRAGIGLMRLAAFAAASVAAFFVVWQGHEAIRFAVLLAFSGIVGTRVFALLVELLLEPRTPRLRLLPFDDRAARVLHAGLLRLAITFAFIRVAGVLLLHFSAPSESYLLFATLASLLFVLLMLDTAWKVRADVAGLIRGTGDSGHLRRLLAEIWPWLAALYMSAVFLSRLYDMLLGNAESSNASIGSVVLILVLPLVDMLLCRIVAAAMLARANGAPAAAPGEASELAEGFGPVLQRAIHIVVFVAGLLILADLWGIDPFAMAEHSLGGRITSAIFGIAVTTLLAWILWEAARTAIDRRMNAETATGKPVSRLRTLLPLLRVTLQITILVIAVLSILAALGINIVPLLAGASVVGLAVGFGSQTLVRDIVSGAFFLMDDAFRLGEYIEVGDAKGTVEKIGLRSVILRHHRGALNVLPYGEIKRLRNTSRDWMILVMEFRLAHDTDLGRVKKIMKKIGQDLAADPEFGVDILEPLKSQGVLSTDDSSLVVRAKFMAKAAGDGAYMMRREAYARILKAFAEQGVKFATRQITVNVPPGSSSDQIAGAGAAAAAEPRAP